jgi:hypothetical protein
MASQNREGCTHLFQFKISSPLSELVEPLPGHLRSSYARDFHLADDTWHLWEGTLTNWIPMSQHGSECSPDLQHECAQATMVRETKSKIAQSVARLQPLARKLHWPVTEIPPK